MPSIKQVLISLRDPNGVAVRPSGFDCVRPCHSERSGAESNCEAAPSKAKVESRADSAQDDTRGDGAFSLNHLQFQAKYTNEAHLIL